MGKGGGYKIYLHSTKYDINKLRYIHNQFSNQLQPLFIFVHSTISSNWVKYTHILDFTLSTGFDCEDSRDTVTRSRHRGLDLCMNPSHSSQVPVYSYVQKNIERHTVHTIVSWPNLKQWVIQWNLSVTTTSIIKPIALNLFSIVFQWRLKVPIYSCEQYLPSGALGPLDVLQKTEKYPIRWSL